MGILRVQRDGVDVLRAADVEHLLRLDDRMGQRILYGLQDADGMLAALHLVAQTHELRALVADEDGDEGEVADQDRDGQHALGSQAQLDRHGPPNAPGWTSQYQTNVRGARGLD